MIIDLIRAYHAGKELANATTWKKAQVWTADITVLLGALIGIAATLGLAIPLTPDQIGVLASAGWILVGLFNRYTTVATTKRLGVRTAADDDDPGDDERGPDAAVSGDGLSSPRGGGEVPVLKPA